MTSYSALQLIQMNFPLLQGLRAPQGINPASEHNDAVSEIHRTAGGATLADFFVAPRKQSSSSRFTRRFANSAQGRSLQFVKQNSYS